jgi:hypothetical protein
MGHGSGQAEARAPFREELLRRQAKMLREGLARIERLLEETTTRESEDGA